MMGLLWGRLGKPIDKDDLPTALDILNRWQTGEKSDNKLALYVEKAKIVESGDYNLTGEHYRVETGFTNIKWPMIELRALDKQSKIKFLRGQGISKKDIIKDGQNKCIHYGEIYTLYQPIIRNVISRTDFEGKVFSKKGDVLIPSTTTADAMGIAVARSLNEDDVILGGDINIIRTENTYILSDYLALLISTPPLKNQLANYAKGTNILHISNSDIKKLKIPLPPIEVQEQIVSEINQHQKVIDGAKQIIQNWKPYFRIDPEWEKMELGVLFENVRDSIDPQTKTGNVIYVGLKNIESNTGRLIGNMETEIAEIKSAKTKFRAGDILFGKLRPKLNKVWYSNLDGICSTDIFVLRKKDAKILPELYSWIFRDEDFVNQVLNGLQGAQLPRVGFEHLSKIKIPLPPLKIQKQVVAEIKTEQKAIDESKNLIGAMKKKIELKISEIWTE